MCPDIDDLIVAFVVGDEAHRVVVEDFLHLLVAFLDILFLFGRNKHVAEVERQTALERHVVTEVLDVVEELCRAGNTAIFDYARDDCTQ